MSGMGRKSQIRREYLSQMSGTCSTLRKGKKGIKKKKGWRENFVLKGNRPKTRRCRGGSSTSKNVALDWEKSDKKGQLMVAEQENFHRGPKLSYHADANRVAEKREGQHVAGETVVEAQEELWKERTPQRVNCRGRESASRWKQPFWKGGRAKKWGHSKKKGDPLGQGGLLREQCN